MATGEVQEELRVSFHPPLYLQRQTWVLDILRREKVQSVLDIGCGEGSLLQCLTEPSFTLPPTTSLPPTSPFVSGPTAESHADLYLKTLHGLDPYAPDLEFAIQGTAPHFPDRPPFSGYDRWKTREARWMPLEVTIWEGGFEAINEAFEGDRIDAFVASEVIEHLTPELFPLFAPVLLGHYRPRLLLLTSPNFTYNQRFNRPGVTSSAGYPDPTSRTDRVFRHHDHKFEWTTEEWTKYCTDAASEFGYTCTVGGVGLAVEPDPWNREPNLGFASQVAIFRRLVERPEAINLKLLNSDISVLSQKPILRVKHVHHPHPLCLLKPALPCDADEVRQAVEKVMAYNKEMSMTFDELWKQGEISLKCKGDIGELVRAFGVVELDPDVWVIEDEDKAWGTKVTWRNFVAVKTSPAVQGFEPLEAYDWSDNRSVEGVVDDSFSMDRALPESENSSVAETSLEICSWGWGSEVGHTHWNWDDTNTKACDTPDISPWFDSVTR